MYLINLDKVTEIIIEYIVGIHVKLDLFFSTNINISCNNRYNLQL